MSTNKREMRHNITHNVVDIELDQIALKSSVDYNSIKKGFLMQGKFKKNEDYKNIKTKHLN